MANSLASPQVPLCARSKVIFFFLYILFYLTIFQSLGSELDQYVKVDAAKINVEIWFSDSFKQHGFHGRLRARNPESEACSGVCPDATVQLFKGP